MSISSSSPSASSSHHQTTALSSATVESLSHHHNAPSPSPQYGPRTASVFFQDLAQNLTCLPQRSTISIPFCSIVGSIHLLALLGFFYHSWSGFWIFLALTFLTNCVGVSCGLHRLFTHRSYKVPKVVAYIIGMFSTLAFQGGIGEWVARHRMHHAGSDTPKDPHNVTQSFFHAHVGWLIRRQPFFHQRARIQAFARDIYNDPVLRVMSHPLFLVGSQLLLAILLGILGGLTWVIWGIFVRLVFCYHCTWLVNSAAHVWGYKSYACDDHARNNWWVALLSWGEGWHNNHHIYPYSVKIGHKWWELDIGYLVISLLKVCRIARQLRYPPKPSPSSAASSKKSTAHRSTA